MPMGLRGTQEGRPGEEGTEQTQALMVLWVYEAGRHKIR